jgi:hypothetical protein
MNCFQGLYLKKTSKKSIYKNDINSKSVFSINKKFRVQRKQGADILGARAKIQDSWVFHHQHEISDR